MKERPILFNSPMVRAVLDGRKTQTRRLIKCDATLEAANSGCYAIESKDAIKLGDNRIGPETMGHICSINHGPSLQDCIDIFNPYGKSGDRLWVREAWCASSFYDSCAPRDIDPGAGLRYPADGPSIGCKTRPSIHMPRWASRITLEITDVRVERLNDISEDDCRAEGCHGGHDSIPNYPYSATPREHFRHIWQSTGGDWDANPWVWVVEFRRIKPPCST